MNEIIVTPEALKDIDEIYRYVRFELSAEIAADKLKLQIKDAILSLRTFPNRNRIFFVDDVTGTGFRRLSVASYSIVYYISGDKVMIVDVLYSSSDIETRLR